MNFSVFPEVWTVHMIKQKPRVYCILLHKKSKTQVRGRGTTGCISDNPMDSLAKLPTETV
jgi:hypothetical protein